uniref:VWFA domain-containing protein n=1 Tax=Panagrolaimus davidi TaxID=227884 RepID=A0A914Q7Z2_9BILA
MTNSILSDFLPNFSFYETFTAGLSFGSTITSSMYWNNYADMCNFIHSAEETAIQLGLSFTNLSEVFQNYQIDLQNSGRNYQKVLVLLTAKTDPTEISAAKVYADQIMANGVVIIVVALGQGNNQNLSQLGQHFYYSSGYAIPITTIPSVICSYGGQTMFPPTVNPSGPPYDPLSDAVGTPCSTNSANAWVDIIFVVDISNAMSKRELNHWALITLAYMRKITFGTRVPHKTRAGIITYATDSVPRLNLTDGITSDIFGKAVRAVPTYFNAGDNGGYVQTALKTAKKMLDNTKIIDGNPKDIRQQIIILAAAAYDDTGFKGAKKTAQTLKDDGVHIFTINTYTSAGFGVPGLDELASQGYAFRSDNVDLHNLLPLGITQDCLHFENAPTFPSLANSIGCLGGGVLLAVTSQIKLDFITDKILTNLTVSTQVKNFTTGAHKNNDGIWYWWGYDQKEYPLGKFPVFNPAPTDSYSFMNNYFGYNWQLNGTTDDAYFPFMCQNRACDADFICDQTLS